MEVRRVSMLGGLEFYAGRVFICLTAIVCALTCAHLLTVYVSQIPMNEGMLWEIRESFVRLFAVHKEGNIPTWYASTTLFVVAVLLAFIATQKPLHGNTSAWHWILLALVFVYLSVDEAAMLHEMGNKPLRAVVGNDVLPHDPWVVGGAAFVVLFVGFYAKFLWDLPFRTRWLFVLAGSVFVGGAIGIETVGAFLISASEKSVLSTADQSAVEVAGYTVPVLLTSAVEEFAEKTGIAIFIYALLNYISEAAIQPVAQTAELPELRRTTSRI